MIPQDLATALEPGELEELGPGAYRLRVPAGVALGPSASHPFWSEVRALEVASPGTPVEQQRALVDLLLETGAPALRELTGLAWPAFSRLCKAERTLPVELVGFRAGPPEHVLRRLEGARSLPRLRVLRVSLGGVATPQVAGLHALFEAKGQPLDEVRVLTGLRLAAPAAIEVRWPRGQDPTLHPRAGEEIPPGEDAWLLRSLGF